MKKLRVFLLICVLLITSTLNVNAFNIVDYHVSNYGQKTNNIVDNQRYIVQLQPNSKTQVFNLLKRNNPNFTIKHDYQDSIYGFSAQLTSSDVLLLNNSKLVTSIKPVTLYYPLMDSAASVTSSDVALSQFHNDGSGRVISIVDTGIDTLHESLNSLPENTVVKINDVKQSSTTQFSLKVPYGYNFVDGNDIVKDSGSMHGIHVAGIAGAHKNSPSGINGIAPGSQLLAMKVFSNDSERKGAADDDIIAAIEDSIKHKADIINLSLGSDNGINDPNDPMLKAIEKAYQSGVLVVIAAGNSALSTTLKSSLPVVKNDRKINDVGIISSPAVATNGLAVASYENDKVYKKSATYSMNGDTFNFAYHQQHGSFLDAELPVVSVGLGYEEDYKSDVSNKLVLISRGKISFREKIQRAIDKHAKGVIIYNNEAGSFGMAGIEGMDDIFVAAISLKDGDTLIKMLNQNAGGNIRFSKENTLLDNDYKGHMSGFSSWGSDSSLSFKPEIAGVGGQVYSSYNDNKYETISGTSMAAPHVAGASAILMNEAAKRYGLSGIELVDFVKKTMVNTATVLKDPNNDNIYSLRQQGSGLLNTLAAGNNPVTISFKTENGKGVGELKEIKTTSEFDLVFKNYGNEAVVYNFDDSNIILNTQHNTDDGQIKMVKIEGASVNISQKIIQVLPKSTVSVKVSLNLTQELENFVEGVLYFNSDNSKFPQLHFSFLGYSGNWEKDFAIDTPAYEDNSVYSLLPYAAIVKGFLNSSVVYPGVDLDGKLHAEYMAFSPNNDNVADYVVPQLGMLRGVVDLKFEIVDKSTNNEVKLKTLHNQKNVRRFSLEKIKSLDPSAKIINPFFEALWDGKVYDAQSGTDVNVADGKYYYKISYKLNFDSPEKSMYMPIVVDTKKPIVNILLQNQKLYSEENGQRLVKFSVTDENGLLNVLVSYNNKVYTPTKLDGDNYSVVLPYTGNSQDSITISAMDFAYNETNLVKKFDSDPYAITFPRFVTKKVNTITSDIYPTGKALEGVTKFEVLMKLKNDNNVVITKEYLVDKSGNVRSAFNGIVPTQEGKYLVEFNQYNAEGILVRKIDFGQFTYDYTAPIVTFADGITMDSKSRKVNDILTESGLSAEPLLDKQYGYKVTVVKNSDGSATLSGVVSDSVHEYGEIKFSRGQNIDLIKIKSDGSFTYTYKPETKVEFFNIKDPDYSKNISATIDGLDLAGMDTSDKIKGKQRTFVVIYEDNPNSLDTSVLPNNNQKKASVILDTRNRELDIVLGAQELKDSSNDSNLANVYLKSGQYYYDVIGSVLNDKNAKVYINDVLLSADNNEVRVTTDGSSLNFNKLIPINEGKNLINVRVVDAAGNDIRNVALKVWLDSTEPQLVLDETNLNIVDRDNENYSYVVETALSELELNLTVSDNSSGYNLYINGDLVKRVNNGVAWGDNESKVSHRVLLPAVSADDNDSIIQLVLSDNNGHVVSKNILVRRQENATNKLPIVSLVKIPELVLAKAEFKQNENLEIVTKNINSGDDIISVKIDGVVLNSNNYEFVNNNIIIKNLKEFSVGQHQLVVTAKNGSVSVKFELLKSDNKPNNGYIDSDKNQDFGDDMISREELIDQAKTLIGDGVKDKIDIPKPVKPKTDSLSKGKTNSQANSADTNNKENPNNNQSTDENTSKTQNNQSSSEVNSQTATATIQTNEQVNNGYILWIVMGVITLFSCLFLWWLLLLKRKNKNK